MREADLFRRDPVSIWPGGRQAPDDPVHWNVLWVYGFAADSVSSIELVLTDCSVRPLDLDASRVFLYLAGPGTLQRDLWPYRLRARDAEGDVIVDRRVAVDVPDTPAARAEGASVPIAAPACR
jgi:hypothetical protein